MKNVPEINGESADIQRRRLIQFLFLLSVMPQEACSSDKKATSATTEKTEKISSDILIINGKNLKISDISKLRTPLKNLQRIMEYPMSDEARGLIRGMKPDEDFFKVEDYESSNKKPLILRKTAANLYRLAQKYAAMEGYELAVFSAFRSPSDQDDLYNGSGKKEKKVKVASAADSQHVRGGAIDVLLYKKIEDRILTLTPDKKNPDRGTKNDIARMHKYLQLAGFANYTEEPWHNEIGSEEWERIITQSGLSGGTNMFYLPAENKNYRYVE